MFSSHKGARRTAAIEICPSQLHLVVAQHRTDQEVSITTRSIAWRRESRWLHSEQGRKELAAGLKQLVTQHKLQGVPAFLSLSGEYCVTRVVTGTSERVRHELAQIEERSARYLSLGHGPKGLGGSVRQIDARHEHALLTVVNRKTMDALVEVCSQARMDLQTVEPSLVALGRLVGHLGGDADAPVLVVNLGEHGVELGISHRGQLLLDYRPAGWENHKQIPGIICNHLERLQRYCGRYVRFAEGKLQHAYLFGPADTVAEVTAAFADQQRLAVQKLSFVPADLQWHFESEEPESQFSAALGTCLLGNLATANYSGPNLMERVRLQRGQAGQYALLRTFLPAAALLLIAIAVAAAAMWERGACRTLERRLAQYERQQERVHVLQQQIVRDMSKAQHLEQIHAALLNPAWNQVASNIARCLPDDVWLDTITADDRGRITMTGGSFTDLGILEFVDWLRKFPTLEGVALSGTRTDRLATGPAVAFDVYCEVAGRVDEGESNGESS